MTVDGRQTGTYLRSFEKDMKKNIPTLRIGSVVPPGDVNLAYIHTPSVHPEGNLSIINTANIYDNIIPSDQKESLVAANAEGKLEYIEIVNENEIQTRAPETIFPSDNITVTNCFKKNRFTRDAALYYRFEIKYHYDSKKRNSSERVLYDGDQIKLTDANGNPLDNSYIYEIYVTPQRMNPHICFVEVYINQRANENETFFVQYNHIDSVVKDDKIKNVKRKIELYSCKKNEELVDGEARAYLENGKSRVLNSIGIHEAVSKSEVLREQKVVTPKNIFAITPRKNKDGYELIVPQKAEADERIKYPFSYRVIARFFKDDGTKTSYTTGFMTNWIMNKEALLPREKIEYTSDFKDISGIIGMTKIDVGEMIIRSLPPKYITNMNSVEYTIEDDKLNKIYTDIVCIPNEDITCRVAGSDTLRIQAKLEKPKSSDKGKQWAKAKMPNIALKNNRIQHQCTIIAEHQKTRWQFKWEVFAKGTIQEERTRMVKEYDENWNIVYKEVTEMVDKEWDSLMWGHMRGEAIVEYNADGTYTSIFTPARLPVEEFQKLGIKNLEWTDIIFLEGDTDCGVEVVNGEIRHRMQGAPKINIIGRPYTLPLDTIMKSEGMKKMGEMFGSEGIYNKLKIPKKIPYKDICLRIERGRSTISRPIDESTMDFRVNYRFHVVKGGYESLPVDQYYNWFGMNRIRLIDFLDKYNNLEYDLSINVVAWTMFEELEIAPIYAVRIEEDRRIDIEAPRVPHNKTKHDNWYMRVKNGRMFKTINLPGYDASRSIIPQIYVAYPSLIPYAPSLCDTREIELEYEITEYPNQEFFGYRTMIAEDEEPIILDEKTIQVINKPLHLDAKDDKGFIEVKCVRGKRNRILRIADVDSQKGIIYLLDPISDQDLITVRYVYNEMHYTYKGFERYETRMEIVERTYDFSVDVNATLEMSIDIGGGSDPGGGGEPEPPEETPEPPVEKPQPTPPKVLIEPLIRNEWCTNLSPQITVLSKVEHKSRKITYQIKANGQIIASESNANFYSKQIPILLNAADYADVNQVTIELTATADGLTETTSYTLQLKKCGDNYIAHEYQIKIEFEFGDIIENATGSIYEDGDGGTIDSYLFLGESLSTYINFQTRTYDNGNGRMYLDYDRVTNSKMMNGKVQKEVLTVNKLKGAKITYVLHDFLGFFHDQKGQYRLSEEIKVRIFNVDEEGNEDLVKTIDVSTDSFPKNENTMVPADFDNSKEKGYFSLFAIYIPSEGPIKDSDIKMINKEGIQL